MITDKDLVLNGFVRREEFDYGNEKKGQKRKIYVKRMGNDCIKAYTLPDGSCTFGLMKDESSPYCEKHYNTFNAVETE